MSLESVYNVHANVGSGRHHPDRRADWTAAIRLRPRLRADLANACNWPIAEPPADAGSAIYQCRLSALNGNSEREVSTGSFGLQSGRLPEVPDSHSVTRKGRGCHQDREPMAGWEFLGLEAARLKAELSLNSQRIRVVAGVREICRNSLHFRETP